MFWLGLIVGILGPWAAWAVVASVWWLLAPTRRWHTCVLQDYSTPDRTTNLGRVLGWRWHKLIRVRNAAHQAEIARIRAVRNVARGAD
ncbi:hypothetical protein [Curtobacterium sp. MCLR17_042]|uniref:hypothetical protein n=1 Tax=Curtobacterium sp. MCLR17_042 TaxID=2175626 RepID=UPI0011B5C276|nr:hypothetical protein [Curtobacterium sp. MCLR17_042]